MSAVAEKLDDIQAGLEKTGAAFTTEKMLAVRDITRAAIHEIAVALQAGHGRGRRGGDGQGHSGRPWHGAGLA